MLRCKLRVNEYAALVALPTSGDLFICAKDLLIEATCPSIGSVTLSRQPRVSNAAYATSVSTSIRGQRVKIKEIAETVVGNTVWCCNSWFAPLPRPCAEVAGCTFKDRQVRLATPRELCRMFQITTISSSWETAAHIYPKVDR
jgi:hypothetical protein